MSTRREYVVSHGPKDPGGRGFTLGPGRNVVIGTKPFDTLFGSKPTTLESDLLRIAATVYATDLHCIRGERERYQRALSLAVPVVNYHLFKAMKSKLEAILFLLSSDSWEIQFQRMDGQQEPPSKWGEKDGKTLLFSGGLDSLAQAAALAKQGGNFVMVSHDSGSTVILRSQKELAGLLAGSAKKGQVVEHAIFRINTRNQKAGLPFPSKKEGSQRTRSFLFLVLAALTARRTGFRQILYMAENGQMAIHLPLTAARIGAFSTRTAHPEVIQAMSEMVSEIFELDITIENPFLYKTKAETVADLCREHSEIIERAVSCWKSSRLAGEKQHCGECVPCLVRRIALETNGINLDEWNRDLLAERVNDLGADDIGKRNLLELAEFVLEFTENPTVNQLLLSRPELLSPAFDTVQAVDMYKRFAKEATAVFKNYAGLACLL